MAGAGIPRRINPLIIPIRVAEPGVLNLLAKITINKARIKCASDPRRLGPVTKVTRYPNIRYNALKEAA